MTTTIQRDAGRLAVIRECMEAYGMGEAGAEWPNNIISRRAVVYNDGTIAREGDTVTHEIDDTELALCRRMSEEAALLMGGVDVGMGSEASDRFNGFYVAAPAGAATPAALDATLIRARFGGRCSRR